MEVVATWPSQMPLRDVAAWARRVEGLGFDTIHVPETVHDPFTVAALMATATERIGLRTSMVVAFARSPMVTAYSAWDVASLSGGRFQLGVASQVRGNVVGRFSSEWSEPVGRLEDYVRALRAIFAAFQSGEPLLHEGPHYRFDRLQPYFNPGPLDSGPPEIWTGGVNRRMCELAGRVSDGFVCHPTSSHPDVLRALILPALGDRPRVVAGPQPLISPTATQLEERRRELAFLYSTPAYRPQLEALGLDAWSDDALDRVVPIGTHDEVVAILEDWYGGLVDGIVLAVRTTSGTTRRWRGVVRCRGIAAADGLNGLWRRPCGRRPGDGVARPRRHGTSRDDIHRTASADLRGVSSARWHSWSRAEGPVTRRGSPRTA